MFSYRWMVVGSLDEQPYPHALEHIEAPEEHFDRLAPSRSCNLRDVTTLVLTVIGDEQSGLVDALSGVIADHGGSWDESHMTQLAGKFAGIVLVTVPAPRVDEFDTAATSIV